MFKTSQYALPFFLFFSSSGVYAEGEKLDYLPPLNLGKLTLSDNRISVNQGGYLTSSKKLAYTNIESEKPIYLVNIKSRKRVVQVKSTPVVDQLDSAIVNYVIDFSGVKDEGIFALVSDGVRSPKFEISNKPYYSALKKLIRSYYLQRCGVPIKDVLTKVNHEACHLEDQFLKRESLSSVHFLEKPQLQPASNTASAPPKGYQANGGWHDAGDYGKYTSTMTISIARLLDAWERYPVEAFSSSLAIPESNNTILDFVDEMVFGLDFLLKIQREDGMVFRKIGGDRWSSLVPPDQDWQKRYIIGVATDDTAKFVAVMAMAAKLFKTIDGVNYKKYETAALKSWQYLAAYPDFYLDYADGDDSGSGPYRAGGIDLEESLKTDHDDRFWAASALFEMTGDTQYLETAKKLFIDDWNLFEWKDPSTLGKIRLLYSNSVDEAFKAQMRKRLLDRASQSLSRSKQSSFGIANHRFVWGSNKMAAEEGMILLEAYRLTKDRNYLNAAVNQANYLLGANVFSQSFVTAVGERPVRHVNHIYARGAGIDIPGLLVGGPNALAQANVAPKGLGQRSYVDDERTYAVNEYAIDYNASLVALLAGIEHTFQ